jgi:hypothetical protein
MADIYGSNYQKEYIDSPKQFADIGEYNGKLRCMFDSFSGASGGDVVYFGKLPAGARVIEVKGSGLGTAPEFSHAMGDKLSSKEDATVTLDADASANGFALVIYVTE